MNSRHPDPRCVWKGGSEPRLMTPDCLDPLDPVDPVDPVDLRMSSSGVSPASVSAAIVRMFNFQDVS